jgi:two-component system, OmpR family, sensor kinase
MSRLFWKFFLVFWLAQVVTASGVGIALWLVQPDGMKRSMTISGELSAPTTSDGPPLRPPRFETRPHHFPIPLPPIIFGSLVSILFAALLARYFARPIRILRAAFGAAASGNLDARTGQSMGRRKDELSDLGRDFDHMARRLEALLGAHRRLLHDVSHEMRSPLARLRAASDLMGQQPERSGEFAARIEREVARMDRLVGELLTLARLDAGMVGKFDDAVDLREIISNIVDDAQLEADGKQSTIEVDLASPVALRGNYEMLYRAIENVVRNAVHHSPEGGAVAIACNPVWGGRLHITIADSGPGVADGDLKLIFEPFFRSGPNRFAEGYGLGLAITRRIVEAHGGNVSAVNRPEGGLLVTLDLPFG